jgi:phage tail-like protein
MAPVPEFPVNPHRLDPYKAFKFRVIWDGRPVAVVSRVSGLRRTTAVVRFRAGGDPSLERRSPGRTEYEPVTLERGVTQDREFERWADQVFKLGAPAGREVALAAFRKDIRIELLDEAGQVVLAYVVHRCWPSAYQALPDLDAHANAVAIEALVLEHEGWERDESVQEPVEPG